MPNRIEARSAKAALTNATGRLPLLRLFSTPLIGSGGWPGPSYSFELTRVPRPSSAWAGPLSGRMLPYYWKNTCLLSPPRGPLGLDFYSTGLTTCIMTEAAPEPIFGTRN